MKKQHVLFIDDDDRLRSLLRRYLLERNFIVSDVATAFEGLDFCKLMTPDIIILDIMLPGMDGYGFAKSYNQVDNNKVPIIMLSSLGQAKDRIKGLKNGAVDYLVKPFNPEELLLRIQLALRTSEANKAMVINKESNRSEFRIINLQTKNGKKLLLTESESKLYFVFKDQQGSVISRSSISDLCSLTGGDRAVDVLVLRLRRKLLLLPSPVPEIKTIRGKGYIFSHE